MTQQDLEAIRAKHEAAVAASAPPRTMIGPGDLSDRETIGGMECRPFSAGIYAILEMVDSPILREEEPPFADMLVVLYLLMDTATPVEEMVSLAAAGYPALKQAAVAWSCRIPIPAIRGMIEEVTVRFNALAASAEIYTGGGAEKKTKTSPATGSSSTATS